MKILIIILIPIIIFAFYWFSYRPQQIRKMCTAKVNEGFLSVSLDTNQEKDSEYKNCIKENGLYK